ncbi:MAG: hypothetical protein JSS86_09090 [Cyanobacteria bacterium SZAS LIN-2]|nr:hypothetical protein [Cyanobacteria bacterium SZAS LIN-3]MBS1996452.1 hypothetical protein [Cyanobacteria bacterium SZAS LIN-2]
MSKSLAHKLPGACHLLFAPAMLILMIALGQIAQGYVLMRLPRPMIALIHLIVNYLFVLVWMLPLLLVALPTVLFVCWNHASELRVLVRGSLPALVIPLLSLARTYWWHMVEKNPPALDDVKGWPVNKFQPGALLFPLTLALLFDQISAPLAIKVAVYVAGNTLIVPMFFIGEFQIKENKNGIWP